MTVSVVLWAGAVVALLGLSSWLPRKHPGLGRAQVRNRALVVVSGVLVAVVVGLVLAAVG